LPRFPLPLPRMKIPARLRPGAVLVLAACGDGGSGTTPESSSFARIQTQIFDRACTSCHTTGTSFATQSGLALEASVSYQALVNAPAKNENARADGLRRVVPGDPEKSLLYHKLLWAAGHHARDYGSPMPVGGEPLTKGEVEYVRRWIAAGAPRKGEVADAALLDDRTPQVVLPPFEPLAPPTRGYQLKIDRFTVAPNFERELFVYRRVGNASDALVNRIETRMRTGSHHLLLYTFPAGTSPVALPPYDVVRDIRNPNGTMNLGNMLPMGYHVFFGGAMTPTSDYRFPEGVALLVPAGTAIDLNAHYANRTGAEIPGEAYVNLHTADAAQVRHVARTLNLQNNSITLPAGKRTTLTKTFTMEATTRVFMLTSHMHALGEKFVIRISGGPRNGEVVYTNTDWEHPVVTSYAEPIVLQKGEGLTSEITWNNTTSRTVSFGLTSTDEMGIIFGYYY